MKVRLNANWLKNDLNIYNHEYTKGRIAWIKEVHAEFGFNFPQSKALADFLWEKTDNLRNSVDVIVETTDFDGLKDYKFLDYEGDVWISEYRTIHHIHTDEDKKNLEYLGDPFLKHRETMKTYTKNLMSLIPEDKQEEAKQILDKILNSQSFFGGPYALA